MINRKKCPFCGKLFVGQKRNFEHVIPKWLVTEADLKSRQMEVNLESGPLSVGMNSIGSKACATCNSKYAKLEDLAKIVFFKIRDGADLHSDDIDIFLDWLDKIRIGLWLWGLDISKQSSNVNPKFRIENRIGLKDRIVAIAKYPPGEAGKGLEFWGVTSTFFSTPCSFGFFANNIAIITISYEFLLLQHRLNLSVPLVIHAQDAEESILRGGDIMAQFELSVPLKERLRLVGSPRVYGQIIVSEAVGDAYLPMEAKQHARRSGYRVTKPYSLNDNLEIVDFEASGIEVTENINKITLMEMNVHRAEEYIVRTFLQSDFSKIRNALSSRATLERFHQNLFLERVAIENLKEFYYRQTGIIVT